MPDCKKTEVRVQYMRPAQLKKELEKLPLIFLPLATLEWHGPHMVLGVDAINAEKTARELACRLGGVVLPTLYLGTERERGAEVLESLGFEKNTYIVGMDHPTIKGLYKSFYFPEEVFAITLRSYIDQCIKHGYKYIYIVNGHGATNHQEVIRRLCIEFTNETDGVKVDFSISFPNDLVEKGAIGHAGMEETSLMMYFNPEWVNFNQLPPKDLKLKYADFAIVDSEAFSGNPGPNHAVPEAYDPRFASSSEMGERLFKQTIEDLQANITRTFGIKE